jgi:polyhydroxyalkanoate synthesis regulator protein
MSAITSEAMVIEVRDGRLFERGTDNPVKRGDIAVMITTGRKYIVRDPQTGEDMTREIYRFF